LYRSILEGVGFELRLHLEQLEEVSGQRIDSIRAVGGGARSPLWIRIVSDITQRPVQVCADLEVSAAGAAVLARGFLDPESRPFWKASPAAVSLSHEVLPDPSTAAGYGALFGVYRRIYPAIRGVFPDLAAAAGLVARAAGLDEETG
jgi:xylulokinase